MKIRTRCYFSQQTATQSAIYDDLLSEIEYQARQPMTDGNAWQTHQELGFCVKSDTGALVPTSAKYHSKANPKACRYSGSPIHSATNCNVYTTAIQREFQARSLQLCYDWLSSHHVINICPSKYFIQICSRKHQSSLCHQPVLTCSIQTNANPFHLPFPTWIRKKIHTDLLSSVSFLSDHVLSQECSSYPTLAKSDCCQETYTKLR